MVSPGLVPDQSIVLSSLPFTPKEQPMCQSCAARLHTGSRPWAITTASSASKSRKACRTWPLNPALSKSCSLVSSGNRPPRRNLRKDTTEGRFDVRKQDCCTFPFLAHLLDEKGEHDLWHRR